MFFVLLDNRTNDVRNYRGALTEQGQREHSISFHFSLISEVRKKNPDWLTHLWKQYKKNYIKHQKRKNGVFLFWNYSKFEFQTITVQASLAKQVEDASAKPTDNRRVHLFDDFPGTVFPSTLSSSDMRSTAFSGRPLEVPATLTIEFLADISIGSIGMAFPTNWCKWSTAHKKFPHYRYSKR